MFNLWIAGSFQGWFVRVDVSRGRYLGRCCRLAGLVNSYIACLHIWRFIRFLGRASTRRMHLAVVPILLVIALALQLQTILGEQLASDDQAADVVDIGTVISLGDGDGIARSVYESIGWRPPYSPSCGPVASASSGHGCHSPPVFPLPAWC